MDNKSKRMLHKHFNLKTWIKFLSHYEATLYEGMSVCSWVGNMFLVATKRLYKSACPSVGPSVGW